MITFKIRCRVFAGNYWKSIAKNFENIKSTVLQLPTACILTSRNGNHLSTIGMYEQAEGGKGRKLRISLAENFYELPGVDGRSKRMWFFAYLLKSMFIEKDAGNMDIHFNPTSQKLEIECTNFRSKESIQESFLKVLSAIPTLERLHNTFTDRNLNGLPHYDEWDLNTLDKQIQNIKQRNISNSDDIAFKRALALYINDNRTTQPDDLIHYLTGEHQVFYRIFTKFRDRIDETKTKQGIDNLLDESVKDFSETDSERMKMELVFQLLLTSPRLIRSYFSENYASKLDINTATQLFRQNDRVMSKLPENIRNAVAKEVLKEPIPCLEYADAESINNKAFVLEAIKAFPHDLVFAVNSQNDQDVVMAAVSINGDALQYASKALQNDRDIVMAAVSNKGYVLKYASEALQNDRDIVLAAVSNDGTALKYASKELQSNKDIVLAAIKNCPPWSKNSIRDFISEKIKNDTDIIQALKDDNDS